jgi:methanogenic corrinoid protein MtbC1
LSLARGWASGLGPRALLACPSGERHTLGLVGFGIALARRGWRITYLGAETPAESVVHATDKVDPSFVVLAASRPEWFARDADALSTIAWRRPLLIAGAGATHRLATQLGAERLTSDPVTSAAEVADRKKSQPA